MFIFVCGESIFVIAEDKVDFPRGGISGCLTSVFCKIIFAVLWAILRIELHTVKGEGTAVDTYPWRLCVFAVER